MGYRSDIAVLVYPNDREKYPMLKTLMGTTFKDIDSDWDGCIHWEDTPGVLRFEISDIKWYESYPEVQRFEKFLSEVEELGFEFECIRIGEEAGDVERKDSGNSQGHLDTATEFVFNY